jgi:hypothetical protein
LPRCGTVRWRRVDLARMIKTRFNVTLAQREIRRWSVLNAVGISAKPSLKVVE